MVAKRMDHTFHLLPPSSKGNLMTMMMTSLSENGSSSSSAEISSSSIGFSGTGTLSSSGEFNFSVHEAYQVLMEHQMNEKILHPGTEIGLILAYSILMTSGFVSNALVCFVVGRQCARKRSSNSAGPTPRNLYIVNLALADMALCLICMPFTLVSLLRRRWTMGVILCKLVPVLQGANISVSAGTIAAIALDRYFTIVRPRRSQACRGAACSVASVISLIWGISFLSMLPLFIYQEVETITYGGLVLYEACVERWPSRTWQITYTVCLMVAQFLVPVVVLSVIHTKISTYLSVRLTTPPRDSNSKRAKREWRRNRRTIVILSCIAVVFAISWLPMTGLSLLIEIDPELIGHPRTMYTVFAGCHILAMSSACTNPLLYGWLNTNFRRELTTVLRIGGRGVGEDNRGEHCAKQDPENKLGGNSVYVKTGDRRISLTFLTTLTTGTSNRTNTTTTGPSSIQLQSTGRRPSH